MTVKYVPADTSSLEKPERLVPDTDFMTPIRVRNKKAIAQQRCKVVLLVLVLLVAFLGLLFLLQSLLMSCVGQECGTDSGVPFDNLNQERPTPVDPEGRNLCMLDSDRGMCMAAMPRWYFDAAKGGCVQFTYGGCGGNANNFKTLSECNAACDVLTTDPVIDDRADACQREPDAGPCKAIKPRFFFDPESRTCLKFQYGGCAGNGNNFLTEDECRDKCVYGAAAEERSQAQFESREEICKMEAESGRCRGAFPKWYHDAESGQCEEFTWGGCGGNENQFATAAKCKEFCGEVSESILRTREQQQDDRSASLDGDVKYQLCTLPVEVGACRAAIPRHFYNAERGECESFIYGGCNGNENNFEKAEDCEAMCSSVGRVMDLNDL